MAAEGSSFTNLLKLMKTQGYNKDNHTTVGWVTSLSPLTFKLDGFEITEGDYYIAQRLIEHTRDVEIETTGITEGKLSIKDPLKVGDVVIVLIDGNEFFIIDKVVKL